MKAGAKAILRQNGRYLSVRVRKAGEPMWGNMASCGRLVIGLSSSRQKTAQVGYHPTARCHLAPHKRRRFHFYVAHPSFLRVARDSSAIRPAKTLHDKL